MYFFLLQLILITNLFSNHFDKQIFIDKSQILNIQNLSEDYYLTMLKQEVKENLQKIFTENKFCNLKMYQYKIKDKEDFFYIMAKSSLDPTTLLSLNKQVFDYEIKDFQSNTVILLSNCRGYFSLENLDSDHIEINLTWENFSKKIYFYPGQKNISFYTKYLRKSDQKLGKQEFNFNYRYPVEKGQISSFFGWRINPITKQKEFHNGIDIQTKINQPVYAPIDGNILFCGSLKGYGNTVILENPSTKEIFLFAHLSKISKRKNEPVKKNEIIGYTGNTGLSTGPHLHLEYKKNNRYQNPLEIFPKYW